MGWEFEEGGSFGSEKAADDYAKRNNLDPRDVRIRRKGDSFEIEIRRSALGDAPLRDAQEGRKEGW